MGYYPQCIEELDFNKKKNQFSRKKGQRYKYNSQKRRDKYLKKKTRKDAKPPWKGGENAHYS